jgi:hypothetical protein
MATKMCEVIELVGAANVVAIVTDNAAACKVSSGLLPCTLLPCVLWASKRAVQRARPCNNNSTHVRTAAQAAGALVEQKYSHITWLPCTAHVCDLLLEDIGKMDWAKGPIAAAHEIVTYLTNHQWSDALVKRVAKRPGAADGTGKGSGLELLKPGALCWLHAARAACCMRHVLRWLCLLHAACCFC